MNKILWNRELMQRVTHCKYYDNYFPWEAVNGFCFDSRQDCTGKIFIAIKGVNFNANDKIPEALSNGAVAVLSDAEYADIQHNNTGIMIVDCVLNAMKKIAKHIRAERTDMIFIAVTGSNGKTSTRDFIAALLRKRYGELVHSATRSNNNEYGTMYTMLSIQACHKFCICEVGTNHQGEIVNIADIIMPHISLITNIGTAHIGHFGDKSIILKEKAILFQYTSLYCLMCYDDVLYLPSSLKKRVLTFGRNYFANIHMIKAGKKITIRCDDLMPEIEFSIPYALGCMQNSIVGGVLSMLYASKMHNFNDIHAYQYKLQDDIDSAIPISYMQPGRLYIKDIKYFTIRSQIFDSSYNSNYESFIAALKIFNILTNRLRKVAFIGHMNELGCQSRFYHLMLIKHIINAGFQHVILLGDETKIMVSYLQNFTNVYHFNHVENASHLFESALEFGSGIFIKGARINRLDVLTDRFLDYHQI